MIVSLRISSQTETASFVCWDILFGDFIAAIQIGDKQI